MPFQSLIPCWWQSVGSLWAQWWITSRQLIDEAPSVSLGSEGVPLKLMVSPTFQRALPSGVSMVAVGAVLPSVALMVTVSVSTPPRPSLTRTVTG